MCLNAGNFVSEICEVVRLSGLCSFILDEVGCKNSSAFNLYAQMCHEATSSRSPVVLKRDLVEDG